MTPNLSPAATLDLIPDPAEVHAQIRTAARTSRLLRRQLRLSLAARTEREAADLGTVRPTPVSAGKAVAGA